MRIPDLLWHYTCEHRHAEIQRGGSELHPNPTTGIIWLTDLGEPDANALGLTHEWIDCDRTTHRYAVAPQSIPRCVPYGRYRSRLNEQFRDDIELLPGAQPRHWFVSEWSLFAVYDPLT